MKDKEKQIEAMEQFLVQEIVCSKSWKPRDIIERLSKMIIPKDSVVLSREEYDTLKTENDKYVKDCINYLATINKLENKVWEVEQQSSKETAEKILNELNNLIKNNEDFGRGVFGWKTEEILMLLKIYADKQGVEIKE